MSRPKFHVRRGDIVQVVSGNHRGATGKVLEIKADKAQVIVEGVRMIKKHQRKSQDHPNGAIIEREGPIHVSNVKLVEKATTEKKPSKKAA
ncbi:MAG: 50S ribosomal protein L24 [Terrimicrobiaceae bacterium]|nr:50S ribosomal protein L24 [Terrimicrobiaceae bacterium]